MNYLYRYFYRPESSFKGLILPLSTQNYYHRAVGYKKGKIGSIVINKGSLKYEVDRNDIKFFDENIEVPSEIIRACMRFIFNWENWK